MELQGKKLDGEIFSVSAAGPELKREAYYTCILHTKEEDFHITMVEHVDIKRDFNNSYSDYVTVSFLMPLGDFVKHVYNNRNELRITLDNRNVGSRTKERFKFTLGTLEEAIESGKYDTTTLEELNKKGYTKISGQCVNETILTMRTKTTFGVWKDATVSDTLSSIMMSDLKRFSAFGGLFSAGMEIASVDNTRKYKHIVIPDGTKVLDVPTFLQHGTYGVYNGGIGVYLQANGEDNTLYIFPLYRTNLLSFVKKKLFVIASNNATIGSIDSTYAYEGDMLKILVTSSKKTGDSDTKHIDKGLIVESIESDSILSRPVEVTEDKVVSKPVNVKRKLQHKESTDGATVRQSYPTNNNQYAIRSDVLQNDGSVVQVQWNFSNARLLNPGMPVIYLNEDKEGGIIKTEGILQQVDVMTDCNKKMEVAILHIFLANEVKDSKTKGSTAILSKIF